MHPAGHPLNGVVVRTLMMLPVILLGISPEAAFAAGVINGFQGIVSHFNVDSRAGWFNNIFMGTELHRFHHSVDVNQAKNYAATFTFWDRLFGTYRHPGPAPEQLGIKNRNDYPENSQWIKLMMLPFR
jgi:sterol desaturase/sphingolipid hydroxylase (fatty acid hydroxylase superfamily)